MERLAAEEETLVETFVPSSTPWNERRSAPQQLFDEIHCF